MPRPWSTISMAAWPPGALRTVTSTSLCAGEKETAFSSSSASISTRSPRASGETAASASDSSETRWKPSI